MGDRAGIVQADEQVPGLKPTSQPSSQRPHGIVVSRQRSLATAIPLASRLEDQSQRLCPKCGNRSEHDDTSSAREIAAVEVKEEDQDSFCDVCGHGLATGPPLRQSTAANDSKSAIAFVNVHNPMGKLDEATVTQVRAHVMRRHHQTRRKSQGKPVKIFRSIKKGPRIPRICTCPHQETCKSRGFQNTGLKTVLGSGRSDPLSQPLHAQRTTPLP
jgi:hypothetical protein